MDEVSSAEGLAPGSQLYTAAVTKGRADLQWRELHGGVGENTSPPADDKCPSFLTEEVCVLASAPWNLLV